MPSPFPGMDPYLEDSTVWPDFHKSLSTNISRQLNRSLPAGYYAQLVVRSEIGIEDEPSCQWIILEIHPDQPDLPESDSLELLAVEIRDSRRGHEVVTVIEIVSPSEKRASRAREKFLQKRREVLGSATSLVELDLLRGGRHLWTPDGPLVAEFSLLDPVPDYTAILSRSWQRDERRRLQLFPIYLQRLLPVIPIPLRESEAEVPLDLQYVFQQVYDSGPYSRGAVNYDEPPNLPLREDLQHWAAERIEQWKAAFQR